MINRIYKNIHIKYLSFFKFIFFLRYLFAIFLTSTILYLYIPTFFDYSKKERVLRNYLSQNYDINIEKLEKIEFNVFPIPNLKIKNTILNFSSNNLKMNSQTLIIYPKLIYLYDYKNFNAKKIRLQNNDLTLEIKDIKLLKRYLNNQKNKVEINNLDLEIKNKNTFIINLKNIEFKNYGYKKQ